MRHNKVLGLAIISALAVGTSSSYAGELVIDHVKLDNANCTLVEGEAPVFASEYFLGSTEPVLDGDGCGGADDLHNGGVDGPAATRTYDDRYIYATFSFADSMSDPFIADFELTDGAQFGKSISVDPTSLDIVAHPSSTHSSVTFSGVIAGKGDTAVSFLVTPHAEVPFKIGDKIVFRFKLQNLDVLTSPGDDVKMKTTIWTTSRANKVDEADEKTIAASARGVNINMEPESGTVEIDVSTGSINFTGTLDPTVASLGLINITGATSPAPIKADGSPWEFAKDDPQPNSATLTVTNGNFSASLADPGIVFIDVDENGIYDETVDFKSTSITEDTATWELSSDQLEVMAGNDAGNTNPDESVDIVIKADGTTPINDHSDAPAGTLRIEYGGGKADTYGSKLRHIKRNGVVCSLYNVPAPTAKDLGNIRITNTDSKTGTVIGTLRDIEGSEIFTNQELIAAIAPQETVRLTSTDLDGMTKNEAWTAAHPEGWTTGRAVLVLNSDLRSMEVYGLVREKVGGPLTNMSVGATGNGCD